MPVELKISFNDGSDTLIRVFNSFNNQTFAFEFDKEPTLLEFDPGNEILLKEGSTIVSTVDVEGNGPDFNLSVKPNPFADKSEISFSIDNPESITIELFNGSGKKIRTVSDKYYSAGTHILDLNANAINSGIYFLVLQTADKTQNIKIIKAQ